MKAAFMDKTRLERKSITSFKMEQLNERPEQMAVQLSLSVSDEELKLEYGKDDYMDIRITVYIRISDHQHPDFDLKSRCEEAEVFRCELEIRLLILIVEDIKLKSPVAEEYTHELLSLVYDDFRFIIEDSICRTDFRGLYLPIDFREVLQGSSVTKSTTPD
ncbi:MAG: hypothetical protein RQ757_03950 [Pseudomonadales bacterium]|nr:hypothetical protein [Pseudomonadales bacterium]